VHLKAPRTAYAAVFARGVQRLTFEPPAAFHCYGVRRAAALDARATLANALEPAFGGVVRAPRQLCMPASVADDDREAAPDPARLVGYELHAVAPAPAPHTLRVTNRFGTVDVETDAADLVVTPATDAGTAAADGLLGDFTCYRVRGGRTRERGVEVEDRFGLARADVKGPVRVCVRTALNGGGAGDDAAELACYAIRVRGDAAPPASLQIVDGFGGMTLGLVTSRRLCVRSTVGPTS